MGSWLQEHRVILALLVLGSILVPSWLLRRRRVRLPRRARHAVAIVAAVALVNQILLVRLFGPPLPQVHDEFSYLLAGDTFARGRMTNPTPVMWRHFQTMHELFEPTYMSKYPPGQGLVLAAGQVLFGAPWVGAAMACVLACAALTWALAGWTRPRWALLGGLLAAVHPMVLIWGHSYWAGCIVMLGGSVVLGAIGRILRGPATRWPAGLLGMGGGILVLSRPYEAFIWGLLAGTTLLWCFYKRSVRPHIVLLPAIGAILPFLGLQLYYDWRVTGNPLLMPYTVYTRMNSTVPLFFLEPMPAPPDQQNPQLRELAHREYVQFVNQSNLRGWATELLAKGYAFFHWHLMHNPAVLLGAVVFPLTLSRVRSRWLLIYAFGFVAAYAAIPWFVPHYTGAVVPILFAVAAAGLRRAYLWRPRWGAWLVVLVAMLFLPNLAWFYATFGNQIEPWAVDRDRIEKKLRAEPGGQLVIVHYADDHIVNDEWVFNGGEIDSQRVVWARHLSDEQDRELIAHYPDRRVWMLDADQIPPAMHSQ